MSQAKDYDGMKAELGTHPGLPERVLTMCEWLANRIEQHEVFGDEVGTETDFKYLLLAQLVLRQCGKHFDTCPVED